jgi:molybdopterin-guanine dinucleotide biosynthesis protein A
MATSAPLLLVLAVDLPQARPETLRWLLQHCTENTGVIPRLNGQPEPLLAVYPKVAHPMLREALAARRFAAQAFARNCVAQGWARWADVPFEHHKSFTNCNSPGDWEALTAHA